MFNSFIKQQQKRKQDADKLAATIQMLQRVKRTKDITPTKTYTKREAANG